MKDLRTAFLVKYPKYEIILNMYSKANDCPATLGEIFQKSDCRLLLIIWKNGWHQTLFANMPPN